MGNGAKTGFEKPPQSYWISSTSHEGFQALNEDTKVDTAIIGGGIAGILTAYFLNKHGVETAIIEADRILRGTTGNTTAKITLQHGLIYDKTAQKISMEIAEQYAEANGSAIRMYERIIRENSIECDYMPQSAYVFTMKDEYVSKIDDEADTVSKLGMEAAYLEEIPFPFPIKAAVRIDNQAQFHPLKFLLAVVGKITEGGVRIYEQSRVVNIEEDGNYVLLTGQGKKVSANRVIIASHYPFINKQGLYFTRIYPERSYVTAIRARESYPGGMYITAEEPGRSLRSQVSDQGELILVGGEHHKTGQGPDTVSHYEALRDFAHDTFDVQDIPYRWSTQDCMTLDGLPYTGHFTAQTPNMYVTTGYGKWGMTNSMASAMILKDLIVDGSSPWQDAYNPSRGTLTASAKNFVVENLNVASELIEGKISSPPSDTDILPGEGKIIKINGQRAGAYRDEEGTLHVVDTTCTHMGCELNWNSAEKTWDCPCHGSRFTFEGDVVEGPAVKPLSVYNDVKTIEKLVKEDY
jgi:glycine/D-amino acid oxidase-like deaminating enzyme/nitrite reductase/ring-hydroxylating ferredoxin subunit